MEKGDTENNILEMIRASYESVKNQFPEIENLVYNPKTDKIENKISGREYSDKELYKISDSKRSGQDSGLDDDGRSSDAGSKITAGSSTITGAVLTGSILRGTSSEGSELLAKLSNRGSERLNGILYALPNTQTRSQGGFSVSSIGKKIPFLKDRLLRNEQTQSLPPTLQTLTNALPKKPF